MLGRSLGGGNSNPLQYSCLENFMNRGAWWATVHVVTNNWTRLSNWSQTHTHTYSWSKYIFTIYISINSVLLVSDMLVLTMFWALETQDLQENLFHFSKADAKLGVIFYSNVVILPAVPYMWHRFHYARHHFLTLWPQTTVFMSSQPLYLTSCPLYMCHHIHWIDDITKTVILRSHPL